MRVAFVLRESVEFRSHHVNMLADSILNHNDVEIVCLTDAKIDHPHVEKISLLHKWDKWWPKLELFNLCRGPTLYLDLDTVVVGKLPEIGPKFTMLTDVYKECSFGSGVMSWQESPVHLYEKFKSFPAKYMQQYSTRAKWGDQAFISDHLGFTPDTFGSEYKSYKAQCSPLVPKGTQVVYFHGKPRPWNVTLEFE